MTKRNRVTFRPVPKPFSEKSRAEQMAECRQSIRSIEATYTGDNRFGFYGQSCRESLERWRGTLAKLEALEKREAATEPTEQGNQYVIPGCERDKSRGPTQADLF